MAERGGQAAAFGFQYQYLVTLEELLTAAEGLRPDVHAALIEPTCTTGEAVHDPDAIDFDLVGAGRAPVLAAQVKSGGPGTELSAPAAFAVLVRMIKARPSAKTYSLITNMSLHAKAVRLNRVLGLTDPDELRLELAKLLERSPKQEENVHSLGHDELLRLRRARIVPDSREPHELREHLRERIRRFRSQQRSGLGLRSAGRMTNHLVSEILRRACGEFDGVLTLDEFRAELLTESTHLAHDLGNFDWGIMVGPVPSQPDLPRPELLERMHRALTESPDDRVVRGCAVLGLSGIGKTSAAAAYAHDVADSYDQVFWLDAESDAALVVSYRILHDWLAPQHEQASMDSGVLRNRVRALLSALPGRWLMVVDNASDRRRLLPWLPTGGRGHVIITSTNQSSWATHPRRVTVAQLTTEEAVSLVRLRLSADDAFWSETHEQVATELVRNLEHWPLAIELACGYLAGCGLGLAEVPRYLEIIRDRALDDEQSVPPDYPRTLVAAILVALQRIGRAAKDGREQDTSSAALASIIAASYMASRQIPLQLLVAAAVLSKESVLRSGLKGPMVMVESPGNSFSVLEIHRALRSESLVQRGEPLSAGAPHRQDGPDQSHELDETISINEIVQHVVRGRLEGSGDMERILSRAAFHTQSWLAEFIDNEDEHRMHQLVPHAQSLAGHALRLGISSDDLAVLYGNLGGAHFRTGSLDEARICFESELAILMARTVPAPVLELKTRVPLVDLMRKQGARLDELVPHLKLIRELALQIAESRPADVVNAIANVLAMLRKATHREVPGEPVARLITDLRALVERLPATAVSEFLADIEQITQALSDKNLPDHEIEHRCRALLDNPRLPIVLRINVIALLAEALAFQKCWAETEAELAKLATFATTSKLDPIPIATAVHNVGLQVGMAFIQNDIAALPVLRKLVEIINHPDGERLGREPDQPLKLLVLRLLGAIDRGDRTEIKALLAALEAADKSLLDAAHEIGWRLIAFMAAMTAAAALSD
ncbi:NB-ARC domain-containing protein [Streptomyces sp. NPDC001523]|uniref:NB-ARC domain-containing protein n=1 Tax=Streptomyces sp. NPDC001523 TaxID=3154383 RepID=UPI00331A0319